METIQPWHIESFLQAMHTIASALSVIAIALAIYPWLGGFGSGSKD